MNALHVIQDPNSAATALHPLRQRILGELAEPDSAAGLARRMGLPRQQLNYHLHELEKEQLVEEVGERKQRNCTERLVRAVARSYVISPATLGALATDPAEIRDRASSAYLIAVAARTLSNVAALRARAQRTNKRVPTLTVETEVRFASPDAQHAFGQELAQEVARIVAKYHDDAAPDGRRFRLVTCVHPAQEAT
jgi:DNA-binding transcriptional ArsR family regulator